MGGRRREPRRNIQLFDPDGVTGSAAARGAPSVLVAAAASLQNPCVNASWSLRPAARGMLALFALTAAVWLFHIYGRTLPTAAVAAVWAALSALMFAGLMRRARIRRAAFLSAYFNAESPLERRLRGGWPMAARALLLGATLALLLAVGVLRLDQRSVWVVLVGGVPVVVLTQMLLTQALEAHVSRRYLPELAWRVTLVAVGALMVAVLMVLAFHRAYPALGTVSLERAVWHLVDQEHARSTWAQALLQMAAAKDALRLWLAQQLMPQPGTSLVQALGWLVVLAEEVLFVWSYLSLCGAVLMRTTGGETART